MNFVESNQKSLISVEKSTNVTKQETSGVYMEFPACPPMRLGWKMLPIHWFMSWLSPNLGLQILIANPTMFWYFIGCRGRGYTSKLDQLNNMLIEILKPNEINGHFSIIN